MKKLTSNEFDSEISNGAGLVNYLCGRVSKNGKMCILIAGGMYLFEKNEIGNKDWIGLIEVVNNEARCLRLSNS